MTRPVPRAPAESMALYEALLATHPTIELKGAAMPYTSLNGNMFRFLTPVGTLALRLAQADRDAFLVRFGASLCVQHGVVMKEYVEVPTSLLRVTLTLGPYLAKSFEYVSSLKPKPTKKGAPSAKVKQVAPKKTKATRPAGDPPESKKKKT